MGERPHTADFGRGESNSIGGDPAAGGRPREAEARWRMHRFSAIEFLVVLSLWIISSSFVMRLSGGDMIEAGIASLVLVSAVAAVGGRRRTLVVAIVLAAPVLACKWLNHLHPELMPRPVYTSGLIVFMAFIIGHHLRFVLRARAVNLEVLCAGISIYLMLGVLWACAFLLVWEVDSEAFAFTVASDPQHTIAGFRSLYFSLGTLSGCAFGDVVPVSNAARILALMETTIGMFYVAILIARLVSLYSTEQASTANHDSAPP
jgi:hypothetical protein